MAARLRRDPATATSILNVGQALTSVSNIGEYLLRLPLPAAQLYSRAYNIKDARSRHDNAFYLCESLVKLTAAPAVACYLDELRGGAARAPSVDGAFRTPSTVPLTTILRQVSGRSNWR